MAFCNWSFTWPLIILIFPEGKSHIVNRELPWRKTSLDGPPQMWFAHTFYCHTRQSNTSVWSGLVTSTVFCLPSDGCLFLIEKNCFYVGSLYLCSSRSNGGVKAEAIKGLPEQRRVTSSTQSQGVELNWQSVITRLGGEKGLTSFPTRLADLLIWFRDWCNLFYLLSDCTNP